MNINAIIYGLLGLVVAGGNVFNAGDVKEGTPIEHTFLLVNEGKDTVRITRVRRTCGCTTVNHTEKTLQPGDTFPLSVKVNTYGFQGNIHKSVFVYYVTPGSMEKRIRLEIRAKVYKNSETPLNVFFRIKYGIIFDIRGNTAYSTCHIAGSENIDAKDLLSMLESGKLQLDREAYIYLLAPDSIKGAKIVKSLRKMGYGHSFYIDGGIEAWQKELGKVGLICSR